MQELDEKENNIAGFHIEQETDAVQKNKRYHQTVECSVQVQYLFHLYFAEQHDK